MYERYIYWVRQRQSCVYCVLPQTNKILLHRCVTFTDKFANDDPEFVQWTRSKATSLPVQLDDDGDDYFPDSRSNPIPVVEAQNVAPTVNNTAEEANAPAVVIDEPDEGGTLPRAPSNRNRQLPIYILQLPIYILPIYTS